MDALAQATSTLDSVEAAVAAALARRQRRLLVFGVCGAQGSGKSTLAGGLAERFEKAGTRTAILSIDDLYKTRSEREALARDVHPLLRTRGVPGTHDIDLGLETLARLDRGLPVELPRFDKSRDDREPPDRWTQTDSGLDLLLLEGWCVGAVPQDAAALAEPVNALERDEDQDGDWRRYVNTALAGDYQKLFGRLDGLALLAAPGFEVVEAWRQEQEQGLRRQAGAEAPGVMSDAQIARFISHYERLTRHILSEMPARADLVIELNRDRSARRTTSRNLQVSR
jgi:D-glycerate 3-kinase